MSFNKHDFVPSTLVDVKEPVQGLGKLMACQKGTLQWTFEDDNGIPDTFDLPELYLVKELPV
jgi:hypothetical protein